jgi:hypothetical protein
MFITVQATELTRTLDKAKKDHRGLTLWEETNQSIKHPYFPYGHLFYLASCYANGFCGCRML